MFRRRFTRKMPRALDHATGAPVIGKRTQETRMTVVLIANSLLAGLLGFAVIGGLASSIVPE
jgi:hypothetical protein